MKRNKYKYNSLPDKRSYTIPTDKPMMTGPDPVIYNGKEIHSDDQPFEETSISSEYDQELPGWKKRKH